MSRISASVFRLLSQYVLSVASLYHLNNSPKSTISDPLKAVFNALGVNFSEVLLSIAKASDSGDSVKAAITDMKRNYDKNIEDLEKRKQLEFESLLMQD